MDAEEVTTFDSPYFVRCEQRGKDLLLLERLKEGAKALDGRLYKYAVIYRWLRDPSDRTSVLGSDRSFCSKDDAEHAMRHGLFSTFRLFP